MTKHEKKELKKILQEKLDRAGVIDRVSMEPTRQVKESIHFDSETNEISKKQSPIKQLSNPQKGLIRTVLSWPKDKAYKFASELDKLCETMKQQQIKQAEKEMAQEASNAIK